MYIQGKMNQLLQRITGTTENSKKNKKGGGKSGNLEKCSGPEKPRLHFCSDIVGAL